MKLDLGAVYPTLFSFLIGIAIPSRHRTEGYAKLAISIDNASNSSVCDISNLKSAASTSEVAAANSSTSLDQVEVCEKATETTPSLCQYDFDDLDDEFQSDEEIENYFYPDELNYLEEDAISYYGTGCSI